MPYIIVLPHVEYYPEGIIVEAKPGMTICDALLGADIEIKHACEKPCTCATYHATVREGLNSLDEATEKGEDLLDKTWGPEPNPCLSRQTKMAESGLTAEIPKYTISHTKENY